MIQACNPLGPVQHIVLQKLRRVGHWYPGCGWRYGGQARTIRILDSLVLRGLAIKASRGTHQPDSAREGYYPTAVPQLAVR